VIAALEAVPKVPAEWVDELEELLLRDGVRQRALSCLRLGPVPNETE
jgi:hypothetical protein